MKEKKKKMKEKKKMKKMPLLKDKKAVFGLNAVQAFFAVILGLALLAYVIVVIMGTLGGTTILPSTTGLRVANESVTFNVLNGVMPLGVIASVPGATNCALVSVTNGTAVGKVVNIANFTISGSPGQNCYILNATRVLNADPMDDKVAYWNGSYTQFVTYTYTANSASQNNLNAVLGNTSSGITSFFGSISPVYAILAVLVIILVLVVLVRVVQAPNATESKSQL